MAELKKPMALNITVDDGSRRVPITNTEGEEIGVFTFRPTDLGLVERFNRLVEDFNSVIEPLENVDVSDSFDITDPTLRSALNEAERRVRAAVNDLFASDSAAEAFFGRMYPFSPVNGEFYVTQVLQKVGAFIGAQFDTETKALSKKAKKYLK